MSIAPPLKRSNALPAVSPPPRRSRTDAMFDWLFWSLDYDVKKNQLTVGKVAYTVLHSDAALVAKSPVASVGVGREILLLDPQRAPLAHSKVEEFLKQNKGKKCGDTLQDLCTFVRNEVFPQHSVDEVQEMAVDLDVFIQKEQGVCRHQALFCAFATQCLIQKEKLPAGEVFLCRLLPHGTHKNPHVIALYISDRVWWMDPALRVCGDAREIKGETIYGSQFHDLLLRKKPYSE